MIEMLLAQRAAMRAAGDYEGSDRIRARLGELGITVKDGPDGSTWQYE